ncbi:MAG: peroxiredoxin family protein, partial [Chitinophagaceae bacterium]
MKRILLIIGSCLTLSSCTSLHQDPPLNLSAGTWRAFLKRPDGIRIPFNFQVVDTAKDTLVYLINGKERIRVDSIRYYKDSVQIVLPFFDAEFKAILLGDGTIQGDYIHHLGKTNRIIPFLAWPDHPRRFDPKNRPIGNVSGRWAARFADPDGKHSYLAVGEFLQKGDTVTGTFLTSGGDDRYLEGVMDGDSLLLSTFDGSHAYLFTARLKDSTHLTGGQLFSGLSAKENWSATRNDTAHLPDPFSITGVKPGQNHLSFSFPDLSGKLVSLQDSQFRNKVVVVQIMGSWCPNCMDETAFLSNFYRKYKNRGLEIVGLAYERTTDFNTSRNSVMEFQRRFQVQYPLLITGVTDSDPLNMEKTLPQLTHFFAFPTTLFVDKNGNIQKIETG